MLSRLGGIARNDDGEAFAAFVWVSPNPELETPNFFHQSLTTNTLSPNIKSRIYQ
jgi:hypothetical protein